jgi:mono/diheme cytochrome c family protein
MSRPPDPELAASTNRWMVAGVVLMALLAVMFPIYRIYEPAQRAEAHDAQEAQLAIQGGELYAATCAGCHGPLGGGGLAPALGAREFLESVEDDQITLLTSLGVPGTEMAAYSLDYGGPLTSTDIRSITIFLRSLEDDAPSMPGWRTPLADDDLLGGDLYTLACARCHGTDRQGIEDLGPDIGPTSLTLEESDDWIAGRIRDGYKDMPRFGSVLTDTQIAQIVDFLRGGSGEVPPPTTTTTAPPDNGSADGPVDTEPPTEDNTELLALGEELFNFTAGGEGCAGCHGYDAAGTSDGPNIIGASKSSISSALGGGVLDMADIELTRDELDAVYAYLAALSAERP